MNFIDLLFKIKNRLSKVIRHYIRKPFIGALGKGSNIKSGVRIVGNPYRLKIGKKTTVWQNAVLSVGNGEIVIGDNCSVSVGAFLNSTRGKIIIGNRVGISAYCNIYSCSFGFSDGGAWKDSYQVADVVIEDDVFIGAGAVILPGVTLGKGAIVAAGAVVNKNVLAYTVVGGVTLKTWYTMASK